MYSAWPHENRGLLLKVPTIINEMVDILVILFLYKYMVLSYL